MATLVGEFPTNHGNGMVRIHTAIPSFIDIRLVTEGDRAQDGRTPEGGTGAGAGNALGRNLVDAI